jgi:hypothetical protein
VSLIATCVFLASSVYVCVPRYVTLWFVIGPCVICLWTFVFFICLGFNLLSIFLVFLIFLVLRHRLMDKVREHNSFNTHTSVFCVHP